MSDAFDALNALLGGRIETKVVNPNVGKLIIPFGPTGVGKTTTLLQQPGTLLVQAGDESADVLKESGSLRKDLPTIKCTGFFDTIDVINKLIPEAGEKPPFKRVVIDGSSALSRWCDNHTIETNFANDSTEFHGWGGGRGEKAAAIYWLELVDTMKRLRAAGSWVFLISHSMIVNIKNPDGSDYIKTVPAIGVGKDRLAMTLQDADAILFFDSIVETINVDKKTGKGGKGVGGSQRVIKCNPNAAYEAKNRMNLPDIIELGSSPLEGAKALAEAIKAGLAKS